MFKGRLLLYTVIIAVVFHSTGCSRGKEDVLLRYSPQAGSTYPYKFMINRPQSPIELSGERQVMSKDENGDQIQFPGVINELFSGSMIITERFNSDHPGFISLNFPDDPVKLGAEWSGMVPWYYENFYVLDLTELYLPASYKLLSVEQREHDRVAIIEQRIEPDVAVDGLVFYVGQVGVRWDRKGKITKVYQGYGAYGKLKVDDVVAGINGQIAQSASGLKLLAEKFIQHPKQSRTVTFNIRRNDKEFDVNVEKTIDTIAIVKVYNKRDVFKIMYDIDRGILLSVEVSSSYDVAYTSPTTDPFPVVDSYDGFHKFGFLSGKTVFQEYIDSDGIAWILSLDE